MPAAAIEPPHGIGIHNVIERVEEHHAIDGHADRARSAGALFWLWPLTIAICAGFSCGSSGIRHVESCSWM